MANRQLRQLIVRGEPHPVAAAAERAGDTGDDADHSIRADDPPFLGRRVVLAADRIEFEVFPEAADPMAWTLWSRHLRHDPSAPGWADRDRFVLSAGHGSALLYGLLHIFGYDLPEAELRRFRQLGSRTPGYPEYGDTRRRVHHRTARPGPSTRSNSGGLLVGELPGYPVVVHTVAGGGISVR